MGDEPIKVLLVEDNPGDARLIREMLKEAATAQFELVHVVRLDEALKLLGEASFDVLLLDLTLPDSQGLDTFFGVHSQAPGVPIVVLTGLADEVVGVESVKGGAQDYLVKGQVDSHLLARSLRYAIERKQAEERLKESKRKYKTLFDNTIDGVFIIDAETMKIVLVNPAAAKMYGFDSLEGMNELNPFDLVPPEDRERVIKIITEDLFKNDVRQIREIRTVTKDGREIWIEAFGIRTEYRRRLAGLVSIRDITERKRAEEALRESEKRYRLLAENVTDVIWTTDMNLRHTFVTPSITRLRGVSVEEAMAETPEEYLTPASLEVAMEVFQEELAIEKREKKDLSRSLTLELEMTCKNGSTVWTENTMSFLRNQDGQPIGIVGVTRDITERKRAEETLRESEERFRNIYAESPIGIELYDSDGNLVDMNKSCLDMFGFSNISEAKIPGLLRHPLLPYEVKEKLSQAKAIRWEGSFDFDRARKLNFYKGSKSGVVYIDVLITPLGQKENGALSGYLIHVQDITERKRAEEALRESEKRYRLLAENVTDVIYVTDMNLQPTYMSPSITRLLGYSVEEAMSRSIEESLTSDSLQVARKAFGKALKTRDIGREDSYPEGTLELEMKCKDGSTVWTEITVSFLRDPEGRPVGLLGVIRDITERKKMEAERIALEQRAQIASRLASVGEMASGIAHEINNPLTSVIGFAQLLMKKDIPENIKEDIRIINEGAQRVASIVKRLLTFAHQHKPERTYVNINDIIATTLELRGYEIETSNIKVITQLDPDLPGTMADGGQLQQVFLNIVINAETEMKLAHSKGNLFIKTETIDSTLRISFKDDGPGIAKENLERIFEPFFTTREVGKGTGLGLSICHGIITEHGGRIYAESELGKGATFIVELPIVAKPEHQKLANPISDGSERIDGASILVVDDEPTILQFMTRVLTEEGHQVETVDNANDALDRLKSKRYSLILLDIKLPEVSGIELYQRIQQMAKSLVRRVVFITGDVIGEDTKNFLTTTKALHITKPFDTEQLKKDINGILTQGVTEVSRPETFLEPSTSPKIES
jgi:PAS domain S-box-containing protein